MALIGASPLALRKGSAFSWSFYISNAPNDNLFPRPSGGEGGPPPAPSPAGAGRVRGSKPKPAQPNASGSDHPINLNVAKQMPRGLFRFRGRATKLAGFINLFRRACEGARLPVRRWRTHGFDPLTRPAPADENAGCEPPSPPKGRGKEIRVSHRFSVQRCPHRNVETPGKAARRRFAGDLLPRKGAAFSQSKGRSPRSMLATNRLFGQG